MGRKAKSANVDDQTTDVQADEELTPETEDGTETETEAVPEVDAGPDASAAPEELGAEDTVKTEDMPADSADSGSLEEMSAPEPESAPETTTGEEAAAPAEPAPEAAPAEMPAEPEAKPEESEKAEEPVSEDKMLEELGVAQNDAPNGTGIDAEGAQSYEPKAAEEDAPKDESEKAVEPEAVAQLPESKQQDPSDEKKPIEAEIKAAGNKVYEEPEARSDIGKVINSGTTAAFIEIVQPRQPALEAAMRAAATADGLADGSIKPEDAPGAFLADEDRDPNDGGDADKGNSVTSATEPAEPVVTNPKANAEGEEPGPEGLGEATEKETVL